MTGSSFQQLESPVKLQGVRMVQLVWLSYSKLGVGQTNRPVITKCKLFVSKTIVVGRCDFSAQWDETEWDETEWDETEWDETLGTTGAYWSV